MLRRAETFAEQTPGPIATYVVLGAMIAAIGLAMPSGRGAAGRLGVARRRGTLLRAVRSVSDPVVRRGRRDGIDDFAIRRGHMYGTFVLYMTASTRSFCSPTGPRYVVEGTPRHRVVCHDRAGACADGVQIGDPETVQVADRSHLGAWACRGREQDRYPSRADRRLQAKNTEKVNERSPRCGHQFLFGGGRRS
ncbi:hypothetical protein [Rhodococcus jostii]|uniref:hypothetical protein n=1 Tax=Rhodococcus jostii TaxID=132919 RepID=UPI0036422AB9